jgi:hypothetical protein
MRLQQGDRAREALDAWPLWAPRDVDPQLHIDITLEHEAAPSPLPTDQQAIHP